MFSAWKFAGWRWMSGLLLVSALSVLPATLVVVWPDSRHLDDLMDTAGVDALLIVTGVVALWTVGALIGEPRLSSRESPDRAGLRRHD